MENIDAFPPPPLSPSPHPAARAVRIALLSLWLCWSIFLPETIPLYGLHVENVRLGARIRRQESVIAKLSEEKRFFNGILSSLQEDPLYWEAAARDAGMTRQRERKLRLPRND